MKPELSRDWDEEMATARPHDCVPLPSNHPLYVLYTSGTTGTPKVPTAAGEEGGMGNRCFIHGVHRVM